eukprot:TRINITY_DN17417_c0_g1_i1.p1 TRINITY_DN17417_c0_g1~~TRINITY_DN17417_c0_g1_i1.p1  ORF type:complete len:291 (-),score=51.60 TRINITY_DN17417_c0_g1_i1:205-1077(-)
MCIRDSINAEYGDTVWLHVDTAFLTVQAIRMRASGFSAVSDTQSGATMVIRHRPELLAALPHWHAGYGLCEVLHQTRERLRVRMLSLDSGDEWLERDSPRLDPAGLPTPLSVLPERFWAVDSLSADSMRFLRGAMASVRWQEDAEPGRYCFGDSPDLFSNAACVLKAEVRALFTREWGEEFWELHRLESFDAQFLRYKPGDSVPPWHFDIKASDLGQQCANVLIGLSDVEGGETLLDRGRRRIGVRAGECLVWRSYTDAGVLDPRACHSAAVVVAGTKKVLCMAVRRDLY